MSTAAARGAVFPDGGKGRRRRGTAEDRAAASRAYGRRPVRLSPYRGALWRKTTYPGAPAGAGLPGVFLCGAVCAVFLWRKSLR